MRNVTFLSLFCFLLISRVLSAQETRHSFKPGELWPDDQGNHINAHGGGIIYEKDTYYWFGEHKDARSNDALVGVSVYASKDLYNWTYKRVALSVSNDPASDIVKGCIIERPKVVYNKRTKTYVLFFHLELKGKGYAAARVGLATSKTVTGPYTFVRSLRPNPEIWPVDFPAAYQDFSLNQQPLPTGWSPEWVTIMKNGYYLRRDFKEGQMARDMTVYVDDDGKAYHIFASEENLTLHIAELSTDFLSYTGKYVRVAPAGQNEAPAIFKRNGTYYLITSGCTGWTPNAARLLTAPSLFGPWTEHDNPWKGDKATTSFDSQSTFVFKVEGKKDTWIFMADRWRPNRPSDGRYVWLPLVFENNLPVLRWQDEWSL